MSQGTSSEMYNTLEGWDYGDEFTHNSEDADTMSVVQEDVETVLGLQAVVKSMLDDVIGGQHAQTEQLSNILGSSVLTLNKSSESSSTTHSTPTPHRDIDMEALENLGENLQRNGTHKTTSPSLNSSHTLSSTPQTTQSQTPQENHRPPNRFFSQEEGVWFARRAEGCENGVMPISEVHERLSSSRIENVLALKGYSGRRLCYFVPYWERLVCGRPRERLRRPGYYFVCNP